MVTFDCSVVGCTAPAKPGCGGMCMKHALEAVKKREAGETTTPPSRPVNQDACKRCGRQAVDVTGFNANIGLCATCIEARGKEKSMAKKPPCAKCGKERGKGLGFYEGVCKECRNKNDKGDVMKAPPPVKAKKTPRVGARLLSEDDEYIITIDFTPYPALHERLLAIAKAEMRPPEMQLIYMLHEMITEGQV